MKNIFKILFFASGILLFASCEKAGLRLTEYSLPTDKAFARFALFSPGTPAVMIKANEIKINGANTAGFGGFFPSSSNFPDYAAINPGATLKLALPNTGTSNDSVVIFNSAVNLEKGKFYSVTVADTGSTRRTFSVEDVFNPQRDSIINIRLINACVGSTLNLIRVDSASATDVRRDTIARNIAYGTASVFVPAPTFVIPNTRALRLRVVTTTGIAIPGQVTPPQTPQTGSRRSITVYAIGRINGTVAPHLPALSTSVITNQ